MINSIITSLGTWLYNKQFFCPDFENTFTKLESGGGAIGSSASPPLVGILLFFTYFQLAWSLCPFLSIPLVSFIVKKVEQRAIRHSLDKNISKKISDSNLKLFDKKKSEDKTVPDTDEESQKPVKEGDQSKNSILRKSNENSLKSESFSRVAATPPLFDRNYHHQVE